MKITPKYLCDLRRAIIAGKEKAKIIANEQMQTDTTKVIVKQEAPKPKFKINPKFPEKEISGYDILAEQNKATLLNFRPKHCKNPHLVRCERLLNEGSMTIEKAEELSKEFFNDTGLILHCPSNSNSGAFNQTLASISEAIHNGTFPKEIKHVVIGHGVGNSLIKNSWQMSGTSLKDGKPIYIFDFLRNTIKNGEDVLVCCCETAQRSVAGKPGIGHRVDLSLTNIGCYTSGIGFTGPAKIVKAGEDKISGHYTINGGLVRYE